MKVSPESLEILSRATTIDHVLTLPDQLERKAHQAVAKVIEAAGGKWDRRERSHVFDGDAAAALEPVLLTGKVTSKKQEFDAFWTPPGLAKRLAQMAGIGPASRVLEPSAGTGNLVLAALGHGAAAVDAVELNPQFGRILQTMMAGAGTVRVRDFTAMPLPPSGRDFYDVVLMNPPFSRGQDVHHVRHAADFISGTGRLVAVMSAGAAFRFDRLHSDFRVWLAGRGGTMEPLPAGSFKASGTDVNAVVVTIGGSK